jgi:hypothetical protein
MASNSAREGVIGRRYKETRLEKAFREVGEALVEMFGKMALLMTERAGEIQWLLSSYCVDGPADTTYALDDVRLMEGGRSTP